MKKLSRIFKNLKYRYKITLLVLAAGVIPVILIAVYMQGGMIRLLHEKETDNIRQTLDQSVQAIENQEKIYENLVDYLSYSRDLRNVLTETSDSNYETYLNYVNIADPLLQMPQVYHNEIDSITLYSDSIQVPHGDTLLPLECAQEQSWYSEIDEDSIMQWSVVRGASQEITAFRKFYDDDSVSAILAMSLDYADVLEPFSSQIKENTGGIVTDKAGNVVYSAQTFDPAYKPAQPESMEYICENYTYSVKEMDGTGWTFCIYRPTQLVAKSALDVMIESIPLMAVCFLLLMLLGYLFSRRLVSCLERLTENMNQIHMGFRKVTVSSSSNDEVGVLIRSFNRMMEQINHLISEVYEGKIKLQNSEMKALQAQINPHFLYNSLSIINWKAIETGNDEISRVTLDLSTYYRTSLNRGETMTTVENEIQNIRAYLRIQNIMHDNCFVIHETVDPDILACEIPKLILQPLVENAIDHGLDLSEKEEKCLWISVAQDDGSLIFEVRDNGAGMEQEKADQILTYQSSGYGVRNVYDRIQVLYEGKGDMKVESEIGEGTTVRIMIPRKAGAKRE